MKQIFLGLSIVIFTLSCRSNSSSLDQGMNRDQKIEKILQRIKPPEIIENIILLTDLGAKGDSLTDSKPAFDQAMQWSKEKKGAKIIVPEGVYIVNGPIHFASNTTIELQKGSKLVFGTNQKDYLPAVPTSWEGTFLYNYSPLIYAYQVENIAIIGEGVIDGMGKQGFSTWYDRQKPAQTMSRKMNHEGVPIEDRNFGKNDFLRPQLIQFYETKNVLIAGITIRNSPFWCVHFLKSENITARKIKFDAQNKNNDGFDIEYSKDVLIEDIDFNNADDNITVKAGRDHEGRKTAIPSENIVVRNCRFKGLHAIVIGSEMSAGVQNVFVENSTFAGYCKRALYLKSNADRGGYIRDIYVNNVDFDEVEDAIFITSFYKGEGQGYETAIYDIFIENLRVKKAEKAGIVIQGYPTKKVNHVVFSNVKIDSAATGLSLSNTDNIIFNDVIIGQEVKVPSSVQ